ncbi:MAG TPA: hypothetical protein VIM70_00410 [Clostridium sp.]|uniref:hypothetical protein n=1 Tax=Clostridium sp. TaxID=1506 RepID=UPI002F92B734
MISSAKDEGINIGVKKGAIENAIKVAENFLNMGLTVEQVAKGSELPIEKVIELKKKMVQ